MRILLFTLMSLVCTVAVGATVYKWVDENGVTHYSDQPHENSQKVEVQPPQTYSAPRAPSRTVSSGGTKRQNSGPLRRCSITQPGNDQTFMNTFTLEVSAQFDPAPGPGDHVLLMMDGQQVANTGSTTFTIPEVDRGTHTLKVVLQDVAGKTLCQSPPVTFHVHQASVQNPVNPVRPK